MHALDYTDKVILSILMPTMPHRITYFTEISHDVNDQINNLHATHPTLGCVEFLYDASTPFLQGGLSIGKKRELLVMNAKGKYLCFLDDDEDIAPNYVETLVRLCHKNQDVVTFRSFCKNDYYWTVVDMRLGQSNEEASPEKIVKRDVWHICPIRSSIAKKHAFADINYGEDADWLHRVLPECHTEAHTDQILHSYIHSSKTSEADKITNYVQSER